MRNIFCLLFLIFAYSCGQQAPVEDRSPAPGPSPNPKQQNRDDETFADIQPLLTKFCSECHSDAVFISNEKGFLASKGPTRIQNKSMPPAYAKLAGQWTSADRDRILKFVADNK